MKDQIMKVRKYIDEIEDARATLNGSLKQINKAKPTIFTPIH